MKINDLAVRINMPVDHLLKQLKTIDDKDYDGDSMIPKEVIVSLRSKLFAKSAEEKPAIKLKKPAPKVLKPITRKKVVEKPKVEKPVAKKVEEEKPQPEAVAKPAPVKKPVEKKVEIDEKVKVGTLAKNLSVSVGEIVKILIEDLGIMKSANDEIDFTTASLIGEVLGKKITKKSEINDSKNMLAAYLDNSEEEQLTRPPVVTVMGHVDHGKTSLLDKLRDANVAAREKGGITQHIGAYVVHDKKGDITFIDTPGHQAFTAMRARGALSTDIVVLIVAADDGVKPQTKEAIQHAKSAKVPMIVAINKIDKPNTDLEKVKGDLAACEVVSEDWGGDTIFVPISAVTGEGLPELVEAIQLVAEMNELKAPVTGFAQGVVLESRMDQRRGAVASLLVLSGTLKVGQRLVVGHTYGKIKSLINDQGQQVKSVTPSVPVEVLGLQETASSGDHFVVVDNEGIAKKASEVVSKNVFHSVQQQASLEHTPEGIDSYFENHALNQSIKVLNIVLKADVNGSLEAISQILSKFHTDEVRLQIIATGVGQVTETDIDLARAAGGQVFAFNVKTDARARTLAEKSGVEVHAFGIIYEMIDYAKLLLSGMLDPEIKRNYIGKAAVKQVFATSKTESIAGCLVIDGHVSAKAEVTVYSGDKVVHQGKLKSLRHFKEEVGVVKSGSECGIMVEGFNAYEEGDTIEFHEVSQESRTFS